MDVSTFGFVQCLLPSVISRVQKFLESPNSPLRRFIASDFGSAGEEISAPIY